MGAVAAADFDRDGRLGLFIGGRVLPGQYPLPPQSALLANRGGRFEDVTDTLAPGLREVGMVTSALWTDVDGDGWPDLLLTLEWGNVKYFHNNQGRGFEDWTEKAGFAAAGTGWWTSIAAADFNGDGRPDYVVGNVGLNTQYHADPAAPRAAFLRRLQGRRLDAAHRGLLRRRPALSRGAAATDLGAAIPSILKRFPRNDTYARATLGEILGEDKLAAARRFAATEFRSGVFLSQPDGTYRFEPLPRLAQIAPLQGLVAGDFDGDGHADIYAVQNSYAPIPSVGRFDGGLSQLLRGDGHGHFTPVPVAESGLLVPGDAKALAVLDLDQDGWPGLSGLAEQQHHAGLSQQRRGRPAFPAHPAAGTRRQSDRRGRAHHGRTRRWLDPDQRGLRRLGLLQPVHRRRVSSATRTPIPRRHIRVRWPSGVTTEHGFPPNSSTLTLSAPTL